MDINYKTVKLSTNLVNELEDIARSKNTDIDNTIKLLLIENDNLKHPSYLTTTKVSQNKSTYSSVIPAPIKNKFNLTKGQVLYWDIEEDKIIITPDIVSDDLPETPSIKAGLEILQDFLFTPNNDYSSYCTNILSELKRNAPKEAKLESLLFEYNNCKDDKHKETYKKLVLYLLDYPLEVTQNEILQDLYKEINKLDNSSN